MFLLERMFNGKNNEDNAKFVSWTLKCVKERVRLVEDTALKAAGGNTFAGSIPVLSVYINTQKVFDRWVFR